MGSHPQSDVLIITALKEEADAVRQVADGALGPWTEDSIDDVPVAVRSYETVSGPLRVALTWATRSRSTATAEAAGRLIAEVKPRCLAMCGVCAGRRGKVNLGDVIIASKLYSYDVRALTEEISNEGQRPERFQSDPRVWLLDEKWLYYAQAFQIPADTPWLAECPPTLEMQGNWLLACLFAGKDPLSHSERRLRCPAWSGVIARLRKRKLLTGQAPLAMTAAGRKYIADLLLLHPDGLPQEPPLRIRVAPIATGLTIPRDPLLWARLSDSMPGVLGFDMEAAAIGAIAHSRGMPFLVMKSVVDYADQDKDDQFKPFGAHASARCLVSFLRQYLPIYLDISEPPGPPASGAAMPPTAIKALQEIEVQSYRSFRHAHIPLRSLNVFIGGNGAGKTNLLALFSLLSDAIGGRLQEHVARNGGADNLLHHGAKFSDSMGLRVCFATDAGDLSYEVSLAAAAEDQLIVSREALSGSALGLPLTAPVLLGSGRRELLLSTNLNGAELSPIARAAIATNPELRTWLDAAGDQTYKALQPLLSYAAQVKQLLLAVRVYHFNDSSPMSPVRRTADLSDNRFLRPDGSNLPAFLYLLREQYPRHYERIRSTVQLVAPYLRDFILEPERINPQRILLRFRESRSERDFSVAQLSDGTLRFLCLVTLLQQPRLPPIILIDEPELGLHPAAAEILSALLTSAARQTQLLVATQSPLFLDEQEDPENILVTERDPDGQSVVRRLERAALATWMEDFSLGEMWLKNVPGFGGRP